MFGEGVYGRLGYRVLAPAWPGMEAEVEALREDPSVMNGLGLTEVADHYEKIIRGLGEAPIIRPLWQAATANLVPNAATKVNLHNDRRAPLLLIAGGADHTVPDRLTRANVRRYHSTSSVTDYKEFPGRPHFTIGVPGWEGVADFALDWAERHARPQAHAA